MFRYYQMGMIFQKKGRNEDVSAFFDKVVSIWSTSWTPQMTLDVAQAAEAIQMLSAILKFRQTNNPNAVKNAVFTLAKIHLSAGQVDRARELGGRALEGTDMSL